ncbi:molybdate ABC transporter substrate-binding protein [Cellulomonas wangsupingiae]|uniref:molybdate ABC transporter substrate-binding protein n=1 Tax=Cellulomonas wangsupingiae TaxID=2968085 RepID=UPI001D0EA750|nr:molybdate ABC transporter substrate-binding protein [Cellulomonas wangsupingiae]MCM0640478.1 molybdate ABC transporter substrate-binding protein [Cellulomonas wangsupingiae]
MRDRRRRAGVPALAAALLLCGCATATPPPTAGAASDGPPALDDALVVLAAASLTEVVTQAADQLEAAHPGLTVRTSFAGSSALAGQVVAGAPVDVLVTASRATMTRATDVVGGEPVVVATNRLQLAVPAGNPGGVTSVADLADPDLTVALCAPEVPCGDVTADVLQLAGVVAAPDTLEQDVRAVLTRLLLDEADAGLVYRTDVRAAAGAVEGVDLPAHAQGTTDYPALVLPEAPHPRAAAAFVALLQGDAGRQALTDAGFGVP